MNSIAANLLTHFYTDSQGEDYEGSSAEGNIIKNNSSFRSAAMTDLKGRYGQYGVGQHNVGTPYSSGTWNPAFEVSWYSGHLFNALGDGHFWHSGTLTVSDEGGERLYSFQGTIQQVDVYTFNTGLSAIAAWLGNDSAQAARDLQFNYGRDVFFNKESWSDTFQWE